MNKSFSLVAATMAIVFLAGPALAQVVTETGMDVSDMTCGDFKVMGRDQKMTVTVEAMKMASMSKDEKTEMNAMDREARFDAQFATAQAATMTDDEKAENSKKMNATMSKLTAACGSSDSMMIIDAAKKVVAKH